MALNVLAYNMKRVMAIIGVWPMQALFDGAVLPFWTDGGVLYPLAGCRRAPRRIFFLRIFTGGAGRWPSYRVGAESWPQPRQADGLARWCSLSVGRVPPGTAPDFLFA